MVWAPLPPAISKTSMLLYTLCVTTSFIYKVALVASPLITIFCTAASSRITTNLSSPPAPSIVSLSEPLIRTSLPEEPVKILVPAPPSSWTLTTASEAPSNWLALALPIKPNCSPAWPVTATTSIKPLLLLSVITIAAFELSNVALTSWPANLAEFSIASNTSCIVCVREKSTSYETVSLSLMRISLPSATVKPWPWLNKVKAVAVLTP